MDEIAVFYALRETTQANFGRGVPLRSNFNSYFPYVYNTYKAKFTWYQTNLDPVQGRTGTGTWYMVPFLF